MAKKLLHGKESRAAIQRGVDTLANTVKVTLGPKGRNVVIEKPIGPPTITKDGVTVAKEIFLEDDFENMGAQLVKTVASKTADVAGDGTTTATLLAQVIYRNGVIALDGGANPVALKRGIDKAVAAVVEHLKVISTQVGRDHVSLAAVGTISGNGDSSIGEIIAQAMDKVGVDGLVSLSESTDSETHLEVVDGMQFDRGYISHFFVTDTNRNEAVLEKCAVLITERKIGQIKTLLPLLTMCVEKNIPILVIADDIEGEAIALQVMNKQEGKLSICSVRAPSFGDNRRAILEDIAILTGAYAFTTDAARNLDSITIADLGAADRVVSSRHSTTIVGGKGKTSNPEAVSSRIASIKEQIANSQDDHDKDMLKTRLAKLTGGVAVIKVGAPSETEMMEKKARVEDAIHATRAAAEEGVVPGGGTALIRCLEAVMQVHNGYANGTDERKGAWIVRQALEEPLKTICENAGIEHVDAVIKGVYGETGNVGFNAETDQFEDLVQNGIIDPTKVTRLALENAASVASVMLTTEAMVSEIRVTAPKLQGGA